MIKYAEVSVRNANAFIIVDACTENKIKLP